MEKLIGIFAFAIWRERLLCFVNRTSMHAWLFLPPWRLSALRNPAASATPHPFFYIYKKDSN
jgi:hypothetical protein